VSVCYSCSETYTFSSPCLIIAEGVRTAVRSDRAIKMPRTKATVVKKPKVFCIRVRELYMVGCSLVRLARRRESRNCMQV
jgi:hypothetical protein